MRIQGWERQGDRACCRMFFRWADEVSCWIISFLCASTNEIRAVIIVDPVHGLWLRFVLFKIIFITLLVCVAFETQTCWCAPCGFRASLAIKMGLEAKQRNGICNWFRKCHDTTAKVKLVNARPLLTSAGFYRISVCLEMSPWIYPNQFPVMRAHAFISWRATF